MMATMDVDSIINQLLAVKDTPGKQVYLLDIYNLYKMLIKLIKLTDNSKNAK